MKRVLIVSLFETDALASEVSRHSTSDDSNNDEPTCLIDPNEVVYYGSLIEEEGELEEYYDGEWKSLGLATAALFVDPNGMASMVVKKEEDVVSEMIISHFISYCVSFK